MASRKVVLGAKLGTTIPPESVPGDDPIPNFRRARIWDPSKQMLKWFGIVSTALTAFGAFGVACSSVLKDLRPTKKIDRLEQENLGLRKKLNEVIEVQKKHLEADKKLREGTGAAWSEHPNGEVRIPGVDQGRKLQSISITPPVWKVDVEVPELPEPVNPLSEPVPDPLD